MLMHAVTPPRFAAGSLRSKEEKTIEYMECTDRIGACNDPATLRCGITALQRRKNYGILWSASTTLMHAMTPPHFAAGSLHSKERLRLRLSIHYRAEHYSEGKIVELNTAIF